MTRLPPSGLPATIFKLLIDDPSAPAPLHPGEVLREDLMPHLGLTAADVAVRIEAPVAVVENLLAERARVTADLAIRLGAAFAQSPGYWRALQLQYDLWRDTGSRATDASVEPERVRRPAA